MQSLDYDEMRVLANLFCQWAFEEPKIDADQRTTLIQLSADYEAIADACGPTWKTSENLIDDPVVFIARHELLRQRRKVAWSAYLDRCPSYRKVQN